MPHSITANELKTKGISLIEQETTNNQELIVTVRGKSKYVILTIEQYNYLRECELEAALIESQNDFKKKKIIKESVEEHIKRIISD